MTTRSELATLVEAEHRLDAEVASARIAGEEARELARARAHAAAARLDAEIAREREQIGATIAAEATARAHALEASAAEAVARYDALRGDALDRIARVLAGRLVTLLEEEP